MKNFNWKTNTPTKRALAMGLALAMIIGMVDLSPLAADAQTTTSASILAALAVSGTLLVLRHRKESQE